MANDGAPVCNLPNIGQVPALQAGINFPAVPKAQDLPSLVAAVNAISQIVIQLTQPSLPPFRNNLTPFTGQPVGTGGITQGLDGSNGSPGQMGKDGKEGKKAKDPKWHQTARKTERVKVKNREDEDTFLIMKRTIRMEMTSSVTGGKIIFQAQVVADNPLLISSGPVVLGSPVPIISSEGLTRTGTLKFDREQVEEGSVDLTGGWGEGASFRPFKIGFFADCVGVQWEGGLAFEFEP